jgi:hypothetical protein
MDYRVSELFKCGVTPKKGKGAGVRYRVQSVWPGGVVVKPWEGDGDAVELKEGEYVLWTPPKTLFKDPTIPATWGNLKRAVEQAGLGDDTRILLCDGFFWPVETFCGLSGASFSLIEAKALDGSGKERVIVVK